ncbi:AsnC family transcriptional regulator [Corynebacterium bovis]|uniref:DNA-binding Lrp family transcriptional regulator n=1 Tax=Corynebacterium bovis DSM 20582 = CIP 54.80 TaxID=927655 RepID=A0A8I0CLT0_9CORY|nr:AsnC family transcriptional regulator [Corynebacterium bovis]MBB3114959.1 DNA-binding Lrp family transcriptional regulator [Corynebacterium bovis DSM 20582 = CIP 54.80]MDK8510150.1 AsnC family transcriptional regulator [Corynebacterium bovis]QQC48050.1 AsnC family transcriptional regulator [Corynebacterium bovis]RRO80889.1 hypothetical protein CXF38_05345 [Corynebacterium bovis]RRO81893.1 hypothetical protein CXF36_06365 [Corynebacterium bovis]
MTTDTGGAGVDATDRALARELERDPLASVATLAGRIGVSERTAARRYRRLTDRGLVRVVARTLPGFEGRVSWLIRAWSDTTYVSQLGVVLARQPRTRWVRTSVARDELVCGLVSAPHHDDPVLGGIADDRRTHRVEALQLLQVWTVSGAEAVEWPAHRLDDVDRAVIRELRADGRRPHRTVAAAAGVDATTVTRRIRRLVDTGVLYHEAEIAPELQGLSVDAMVWVTVAPGRIRELAADLSRHPFCRFVAATSGRFTLAVNVVAPGLRELVEFVDGHLSGYGVTAQEVVPMGRVLKRGAR